MTNRTRPPFCPENSSLKHFPLKSSFVKPSLFIRALACIGALVLSLISLTVTAQDIQYRARLSPMPTTPQTKSTNKWTPLYTLVKFTNIPYHEAKAEGERHDRIMEEILAMEGIEEHWESDEVEQEVLRLFESVR
mgnify:CR=1 FL=1